MDLNSKVDRTSVQYNVCDPAVSQSPKMIELNKIIQHYLQKVIIA